MKEVRCSSKDELQIEMFKVFQKVTKRNEDYHEKYLSFLDNVSTVWNGLMKKHQHIYDKLGYMDLIIKEDLTIERKKLKRGRPKKENNKQYMLNVRLDEDLERILKEYCLSRDLTESEAIRELIKELEYRYI